MADMKVGTENDRLILIAAFRYALGRMTYMVDHVASFIEANAAALSDHDRKLIIGEIDEQARLGSLGMDIDERRWRRVQEALRTDAALPSPGGA